MSEPLFTRNTRILEPREALRERRAGEKRGKLCDWGWQVSTLALILEGEM